MKIPLTNIVIKMPQVFVQPSPVSGMQSLEKASQETLPSKPLTRSTARASLGDSGTQMLHGIITEEYNAQLQGIAGVKVFDTMRKNDGTVRAAMLSCTLPIRRAEWFVNPATQDPKDKEIAEFVEHALFDWIDGMTWDDVIRHALLMVPFGVMLFEKVYGTKDFNGKTYVTIKNLAPRLPRSILQWELTDRTFGIQQIRQDGVLAQIPGSKLLIFVNEREGNNWWGTSMLRSAYKHWYYKDNFYKIDAVAYERQGVGVPYVKMPVGYTENDEKRATTIAQNIRANENSFAVYPNTYEVGFMDMGARGTRDAQSAIEHHNKEILQSVLAQFLELGATKSGSGSRALSQDHSDLFLKGIEAIANTLVAEFNRNLIKELVDLNFSDVQTYPVIDYSGIKKIEIEPLAKAYSDLVTSGALTPTEDDQQYMRASLGLPPRTQEQIDEESNNEPTEVELQDGADIEDSGTQSNQKDNKTVDTAVDDNKNQPQATASKKNKAHEHKHAPRIFSDGKGFSSWRKLTFTEGKVNWAKIQSTIEEIQTSFTQDAQDILRKVKDAFMVDLHTAMDAGDTKAISDIEIAFISDYTTLLTKVMRSAYEYGKDNVSVEMGIKSPPNTADSLRAISLAADTIATKTSSDLVAKAKLSAFNHIKQSTSILQAVGSIDAELDEAIDNSIRHTAGIIVAQNINTGRNDVFTRNIGMIYALQRSEVLDERTCDFCLSMDGLTVLPTDTWAGTDIFHENCFTPDSPVLTDAGYKNIEDIRVGDKVYTHKDNYMPVYHTISRGYSGELMNIEIESGEVIRCTPEHKFWVNGEWVEAQHLSIHDELSDVQSYGNHDKA